MSDFECVNSWSSSLQKLAVGCLPEKILTAFQSVFDGHLNEEAALNKCNDAVHGVGKLVEDVENTLAQGKRIARGLDPFCLLLSFERSKYFCFEDGN